MNAYSHIAVICFVTFSLVTCATSDKSASSTANHVSEDDHRVVNSEELISEFMTMMKADLQRALKQSSPEEAINACNQSAPVISESLYEKYGWKIGRTSHKLRNQSNSPDAWEKKVLNDFTERREDGEAIQDLTYSEIVEERGVKTFRYMKAIPTITVCLKCHGDKLSTGVKARLKDVYPHDEAVDFKFGDIRGAFTVSQEIE